jgi:hypothetical protein
MRKTGARVVDEMKRRPHKTHIHFATSTTNTNTQCHLDMGLKRVAKDECAVFRLRDENKIKQNKIKQNRIQQHSSRKTKSQQGGVRTAIESEQERERERERNRGKQTKEARGIINVKDLTFEGIGGSRRSPEDSRGEKEEEEERGRGADWSVKNMAARTMCDDGEDGSDDESVDNEEDENEDGDENEERNEGSGGVWR